MTAHRRKISRPLAVATAVFALGCSSPEEPYAEYTSRPGLDLKAIDPATRPCDDFYKFACGGWIAAHALTGDRAAASKAAEAYGQLDPKVEQLILEAASGRPWANTREARLVGNSYKRCMGAPADASGRAVVKELATRVDGAATVSQLALVVAEYQKRGSASFFREELAVDPVDPDRYLLSLAPSFGELPERTYYLDPEHAELRRAYEAHVAALAKLLGVAVDPAAVLRVETALARSAPDPVEERDPRAVTNPMTLDAFGALVPSFPVRGYLDALGLGGGSRVNVTWPRFFQALELVLSTSPIDDLKHYVRWQIVQDTSGSLDQAVLDQDFAFWSRRFRGVTQALPRASTCTFGISRYFGMILARPFAERYFSEELRKVPVEIMRNLRGALRRRLDVVPWLDAPTRTEALGKLSSLSEKVAYPEQWPDEPAGPEDAPTYIELNLALQLARHSQRAARLGARVDRSTWWASPLEVNAYYTPWRNEVVFPLGILQIPFFHLSASPGANYGAIGSVMGHELIHGFDDQGRHYDGRGALREWWSAPAEAAFRERSRCLVDQFSRYEVGPGLPVDGALTLGENIADLGGVRLAYDAFAQLPDRGDTYAGYSPEQQFFIAFAQTHCAVVRPELEAARIEGDPHAPSAFRVNGSLSNFPAFASAFACPESSRMRSRAACEVW